MVKVGSNSDQKFNNLYCNHESSNYTVKESRKRLKCVFGGKTEKYVPSFQKWNSHRK